MRWGSSNRAHIDRAIAMILATGARRVGILGLAFKPGTDDLRESPILEVIAALRDEGIDVLVHDAAITTQTPLEGQLHYVRHGSKGLQRLGEEIPGMLRDDLAEVVSGAEALVVCHASDAYRAAIAASADRPVIDLVRIATPGGNVHLQGIGW